MQRDYRLHELHDGEFERLVQLICTEWLGQGVTNFSPGPDGGRDGKFHGSAQCFPSRADPLVGHCVLQAKHTSVPNRSCSDREFARILKEEYPKIKNLASSGICDHYLVFTNRKLTGGADKTLIEQIKKNSGVKSAHIVGVERLHLAIDTYPAIEAQLPNNRDTSPFRFNPDEIIEVIHAYHDFTKNEPESGFNSARDFETLKLHQKNKINDLSATYFNDVIVSDSMPHFPRIQAFIENPRNEELATLYHDAADELKRKIIVNRSRFDTFDHVFSFLAELIQRQRAGLRGRRRLVSTMLHYMYCNCDIGTKDVPSGAQNAHA